MGKGYKRKTRWRTLNIAEFPSAPPGDDDDEDGLRKARDGQRLGQRVRVDQRRDNGVTTTNSASHSRSQPKIIFDENEYTRITTPRQDVLFKKGYLAQKKVWSTNNASTSATPSTNESQSASHSTADGSETTEDQQLLDYRENGLEEYPGHVEPAPMSYGTFYDHTTGYYYEYPVMVVGPPLSGPPMHSVLAAMPCDAVPLRPIEWINPAFVPKVEPPYCLLDYQVDQYGQYENGVSAPAAEPTVNGSGSEVVETANGTASWTENAGDEEPHENEQTTIEEKDEQEVPADTQTVELANGFQNDPNREPVLAQPLQIPHHVPPVAQPYMYPGHYMFGPALINVNGMTIQGGPMIRTTEVAPMALMPRRRKKKKLARRKMRRPLGPDNTEEYGPEEEDYSSEAENSRFSASNTCEASKSHPLNPDCKEFEFKATNTTLNSIPASISSEETEPAEKCKESTSTVTEDSSIPSALTTSIEYATEAFASELPSQTNGFANSVEPELGVDVACQEFNNIVEKLADLTPHETKGIEDCDRLSNGTISSRGTNESHETPVMQRLSLQESKSRKKYKAKVREATPVPVEDQTTPEESKSLIEMVAIGVDAIAQLSADDSGFESQSRFSDHPITEAVTQWLRRANSPNLFVARDGADSDEVEEEPDGPPKNLHGNPMPALSANTNANMTQKSGSASCGEFARVNNCSLEVENSKKRKKKRSRAIKKRANNRKTSVHAQLLKQDICEFTEKDSNAGMRVATNSRIEEKSLEVEAVDEEEEEDEEEEREKENPVNQTQEFQEFQELDESSREKDQIKFVDQVRTFEKGEIVVSIDGKLLPTAIYKSLQPSCNQVADEDNSINIEEPDMLECWEDERVPPVEKQVLKEIHESPVDPTSLELVRKYYRLARGSVQSFSSIEDGITTNLPKEQSPGTPGELDPTVDEGLEVYESYYTGKILFNADPYKSRGLYHDDGPIPCKAACCIVQ